MSDFMYFFYVGHQIFFVFDYVAFIPWMIGSVYFPFKFLLGRWYWMVTCKQQKGMCDQCLFISKWYAHYFVDIVTAGAGRGELLLCQDAHELPSASCRLRVGSHAYHEISFLQQQRQLWRKQLTAWTALLQKVTKNQQQLFLPYQPNSQALHAIWMVPKLNPLFADNECPSHVMC